MDALVVLGASLALGSPLALAPWPTAALVVALAVVLAKDRRWALLACALCALGVGNWRARHALHAYENERAALLEHFQSPRACHGEGRIGRSPAATAERSLGLELTTLSLTCDAIDAPLPKVQLTVPENVQDAPLHRGDVVAFDAELAVITRFVLVELPDPRPRAAARGIQLSGRATFVEVLRKGRGPGAWIDEERARVRAHVRAHFSASSAPMAEALLLGDHTLAATDEAAFADSGLSHLLAVSGMHLVLAVVTLERATRALLVRTRLAARIDVRRPVAVFAALLALAYADLAGGSGSAWRAAITMTFTCIAAAGDRRLAPERALGASVIVMGLLDPFVIHDLSFSLSVLATAGLVAFGARTGAALRRLHVPAWLAKLLAPTLAASATCVPLLARIAPGVPAFALFLNLIAIPLSELFALPLCLAFSALPDLVALQTGLARAGGGALELTLLVARFGARLSRLPTPSPTALELAVLVLLFVALVRGTKVTPWVLALLVAECMHRWEAHPRGGVRITHLDVGQGDAALIDLPDGSAMLVDSGGIVGGVDIGQRVIRPFLRARRRDHLRLVVVTHPHPDHFGGLATGLPDTRVDEIWDTVTEDLPSTSSIATMQDAWKSWRRQQRDAGAVFRGPSALCGEHDLGGAHVQVVAPCPAVDPNLGANDNSIVFLLSHAGARALFVGDAEHAEEAKLPALRADLLKIGHHGSRTSTGPAFLAAVQPALAVISAGARNRFGHPHAETLVTLGALPTARTDRMGELRIQLGRDLFVQTTQLGK